jgi:hypothetical protein
MEQCSTRVRQRGLGHVVLVRDDRLDAMRFQAFERSPAHAANDDGVASSIMSAITRASSECCPRPVPPLARCKAAERVVAAFGVSLDRLSARPQW